MITIKAARRRRQVGYASLSHPTEKAGCNSRAGLSLGVRLLMPQAVAYPGRSAPRPGLGEGKRTPSRILTAPAKGSPIRSRWPSRSA